MVPDDPSDVPPPHKTAMTPKRSPSQEREAERRRRANAPFGTPSGTRQRTQNERPSRFSGTQQPVTNEPSRVPIYRPLDPRRGPRPEENDSRSETSNRPSEPCRGPSRHPSGAAQPDPAGRTRDPSRRPSEPPRESNRRPSQPAQPNTNERLRRSTRSTQATQPAPTSSDPDAPWGRDFTGAPLPSPLDDEERQPSRCPTSLSTRAAAPPAPTKTQEEYDREEREGEFRKAFDRAHGKRPVTRGSAREAEKAAAKAAEGAGGGSEERSSEESSSGEPTPPGRSRSGKGSRGPNNPNTSVPVNPGEDVAPVGHRKGDGVWKKRIPKSQPLKYEVPTDLVGGSKVRQIKFTVNFNDGPNVSKANRARNLAITRAWERLGEGGQHNLRDHTVGANVDRRYTEADNDYIWDLYHAWGLENRWEVDAGF